MLDFEKRVGLPTKLPSLLPYVTTATVEFAANVIPRVARCRSFSPPSSPAAYTAVFLMHEEHGRVAPVSSKQLPSLVFLASNYGSEAIR